MRILFERFQLRKDFDTLNFLLRSLFVLGALGLFVEFVQGHMFWSFFVEIPLLYFLYKMVFRTYKEFYYSFWTFNGILLVYILWSLIKSITVNDSSLCAYIYTLMFFADVIVMYIIASPIYFPLVNWWEYDFRYRRDIALKVLVGDKEYEGRLIDIRRGAAGVQCFQEIKIGEKIELKLPSKLDDITLHGSVYSIRKYSFGRPFIIGLKFELETSDLGYQKVLKYWQDQKIQIKKLRYQSNQS